MATPMTDGPQTGRPPGRITSLVVLVLDIIGLLGLLFVTTFVGPRFREIFTDLQAVLPRLTAAILSIPRFAYAGLVTASIYGLIAKEYSIADRTRTRMINFIALVVIVGCIMVFTVAMFLPLETFISRVEPQATTR